MYSVEINNILKLHKGFWGCYDIETLQEKICPKGWMIVHCKEHWVSVYSFGDGVVLLFDPLGPNEKQDDVMMTLRRNSNIKRVYYNKVKVQSDTSIECGLFCIAFVLSNIDCVRCFNYFLSLFHACNYNLNDVIVRCFVSKFK